MTSSIKVTRYTTPRTFISAVEPSLSATREWQNNLPIGIYSQYLSPTPPPSHPGSSPDSGFTLISTHDPRTSKICLVASQSPSYHCLGIFSAVPIPSLDVGAHVDAIVAELGDALPMSFNGDTRLVDVMASAVAKLKGPDTKVVTEMECVGAVVTADTLSARASGLKSLPDTHKIRRVSYPADEQHHSLLTSMHRGMFLEARDQNLPHEFSSKSVHVSVSRRDAWAYFIGGVPVASCFCGRDTKNGKAVSNVYTKKDFRRNGYAEFLVGEVCRTLFEEGLGYVTLFFIEGGTAAGVYERLGFMRDYLQKDLRLV